ncbi:MAG: hypothetical protein HC922_10670 [Leptolyngbyaceae cyanobacterium SM2_3_12]|nr:hypothetical protein [Leptolyngbyaceae cyanobacterium SM2_3_12]
MTLNPMTTLRRRLIWFKRRLQRIYQHHAWFGYQISIGWFGGIQVHPK